MARKDDPAEEKGLGKIIAGKLQEQLRIEPSGCPEAETLAAYFERTLSPGERMACETHLMSCSRCQLFVAELARLSEADERPVIVGDVEIAPEEETGWPFRLVWVTPVLVVLIIGGVWYGARIRDYLRPPQETAMEGPVPAPTPAAGGAESGKAKRVANAPASRPAEVMANKPGAEQEEQAAGAVPPTAPSSAEGQPGAGISITGTASESARGHLAGGPAASEAETRLLQIPAEGRQMETADRTLAAAAPPPRPKTAQTSAGAGGALSKQDAAAKPSALTNYTIQGYTPAFQAKWRVGRGGLVQRYDPDHGWIDIPSGVQGDLFDVTFASAAVGWVVGHEGTVLRTTDGGSTWSRVPSPTNEDLVRVSALSDQKAQIMTRSGKTFVTSDAGRSWKSVSGQ